MSLYTAAPALALIQGRQVIGTLHERVGDEEQLRANPALGQSTLVNGVWGRLIYREGRTHRDPVGIYGRGPTYESEVLTAQAGVDVYRSQSDSGRRDHAGIYAAYGDAEAEVDHNLLETRFQAGSIELSSYTLGAYWTHFEPNGAYIDVVAQATRHEFDLSSLRLPKVETDGFALAGSIEGGYPLALASGWILEPQVQLIYQNLSVDGFADRAGSVHYRDLDSLAGRVGVRVATQGRYEVWVRANLWYEFLGSPKTEFSSASGGIPFRADLPNTMGQIGVGASLQVAPNLTLFGAANYESTFDGKTHSWDGKAGVRINF